MKYRPYWRRILLIAVIINCGLLFAFSSIWALPKNESAPFDNLQEIEWIDAETQETVAVNQDSEIPDVAQIFPTIEMPPLEIPQIEFPPPPEIPTAPPVLPKNPEPQEIKSETENVKPPENKPVDEEKNKIKARVKVFPKDLMQQFIDSGIIPEKIIPNVDKIVLALTIGVDGKTKDIKILRGAPNDGLGNLINLISRSAASAWVFEPFLDAEGKPTEIKTEIEFTPEDF